MKYYKAKDADILADVSLGAGASVWYHATLRGDVAPIVIGEETNIQDNAVLHGTTGGATVIGARVTVGHSAILHGCKVGDESLIGMGSIILDDAVIGKHCIIGAGTLLTKGKVIPDGKLVFGNPAKIVRDLTEEEIESIRESAREYVALAEAQLVVCEAEEQHM